MVGPKPIESRLIGSRKVPIADPTLFSSFSNPTPELRSSVGNSSGG
jgi:hypothetical protein